MMEDITYHKATSADAVLLATYRVNFLTDLHGAQPADVVAMLMRELEQYYTWAIDKSAYLCWYAMVGGKMAGIGGMMVQQFPGNFLNPTGRRGHIMNMYTLPEYRNRGIAGSILRHLQESARELGITCFELHATKQGEPVYVKDGFKLHGEPTYRKFQA